MEQIQLWRNRQVIESYCFVKKRNRKNQLKPLVGYDKMNFDLSHLASAKRKLYCIHFYQPPHCLKKRNNN